MRHLSSDSHEVFSVAAYVTLPTGLRVYRYYGPYGTLGAANGIATHQEKQERGTVGPDGQRVPLVTVAKVRRARVVWEDV